MKNISFIIITIIVILSNINCDNFVVLKRLLKATLTSFNIPEIETAADTINSGLKREDDISKILATHKIKAKTIAAIGDIGIKFLSHDTEIIEFLDIKMADLNRFESYLQTSLAKFLPENYFDNLSVSIREIKYGTSTEIVINRFMARGIESGTNFINLIGEKTSKGTSNWILFKTNTQMDVTKEKCKLDSETSYLCGLITYKTSTVLFDEDAMARTAEQEKANLLFKFLELLSIESALKYFNIFNKI